MYSSKKRLHRSHLHYGVTIWRLFYPIREGLEIDSLVWCSREFSISGHWETQYILFMEYISPGRLIEQKNFYSLVKNSIFRLSYPKCIISYCTTSMVFPHLISESNCLLVICSLAFNFTTLTPRNWRNFSSQDSIPKTVWQRSMTLMETDWQPLWT